MFLPQTLQEFLQFVLSFLNFMLIKCFLTYKCRIVPLIIVVNNSGFSDKYYSTTSLFRHLEEEVWVFLLAYLPAYPNLELVWSPSVHPTTLPLPRALHPPTLPHHTPSRPTPSRSTLPWNNVPRSPFITTPRILSPTTWLTPKPCLHAITVYLCCPLEKFLSFAQRLIYLAGLLQSLAICPNPRHL